MAGSSVRALSERGTLVFDAIDDDFDDDTYVPIGTLTTEFNERESEKALQTYGAEETHTREVLVNVSALVAAPASHAHAFLQSTGHSCLMIWGSQHSSSKPDSHATDLAPVNITLFGGWSCMRGFISRRIVPRRNTWGSMRLTFFARDMFPAPRNLFCNSGEPRYGLRTYLVLANYRLRRYPALTIFVITVQNPGRETSPDSGSSSELPVQV